MSEHRREATRRGFLGRAGTTIGLACLPLGGAAGAPRAAVRVVRERITTPYGRVNALTAYPEATPRASLILIHAWRGLTRRVGTTAVGLAERGFLAIAPDLFDGRTTDDPEEGARLTGAVDPARANRTLVGWTDRARAARTASGRVAVLGRGFGGGWALRAAIAQPVEATVIYYGPVDQPTEELRLLRGPVQGHFGRMDRIVPPAAVEAFGRAMAAAGRRADIHLYDAGHGFADPAGPNFVPAAAESARARTLRFLDVALEA